MADALRNEPGPVQLEGIEGACIALKTTDDELYRITVEEAALIVEGSPETTSRWIVDALDGVRPPGRAEDWRTPDSLTLVVVAIPDS